MEKAKDHLRRNWKRYVLGAATLAAGAYAGPGAASAVQEYLPQIAAALGLL